MNGMTAMRDTVAPSADDAGHGVPYNTFLVLEGANVVAGRAGDTMRSLFPEGSLEGVTYTRPEIWSDRPDFAAHAEELKTYADALAVAAPNGLVPALPLPGGMAGMDHSAMTMTRAQEAKEGFTVPELMGYARSLALRNQTPLPWEVQQDRRALSSWIDAQAKLKPVSALDQLPSSKQAAFAERLARIERRAVPDECFQDKGLMSKWIDGNR